MEKHKLVTYLGLGLFAFIVIFGIVMFFSLKGDMSDINDLEIANIDFTTIEDGTYEGSYYFNNNEIGATLSVTVLNGEVTTIEIIEHLYGIGKDAELILDEVINDQSLQVDTIAGATSSSILILKAIEEALNRGVN